MPLPVDYPSIYLVVAWLGIGESATAVLVIDGVLSSLLIGMGLMDFFSSVTSLDDGSLIDTEPVPDDEEEIAEEDYFGDDFADDFGDELDLDEFETDEDDWDDELGGSSTEVVELERRLDEMEDELESTTSTINTVRSENEELAGSIEEIRDNVRKLLEIYELVTRGVNPFADDAGAATASSRSASGLFEKRRRDPDERGANDFEAFDPASFFADEADGDPGEELDTSDGMITSFEPDEADGSDGENAGTDDGDEDEDLSERGDSPETTPGTGAKTFDDLKSEYESGRSSWTGFGESPDDDRSDEPPEQIDPDDGDSLDVGRERAIAQQESDDTEATWPADSEEPSSDQMPSTSDSATERPKASIDHGGEAEESAPSPQDEPPISTTGNPYLERLPDGVASDVVAVEWMEFLIGRSGLAGAMRAVDYYVDVGWIGEPVGNDLKSLLAGLDDPAKIRGRSDGSLRVEDHLRSLSFVQRLCGDHPSVAEISRPERDFPVGFEAETANRMTDRSRGEPYGIQR